MLKTFAKLITLALLWAITVYLGIDIHSFSKLEHSVFVFSFIISFGTSVIFLLSWFSEA